jgi:hypothetical protein
MVLAEPRIADGRRLAEKPTKLPHREIKRIPNHRKPNTHQRRETMRTNTWNLLGLIAVGALVGCGGGSGGSSGFSTSAPSGTEVQNLTPSQANQLCDEVNGYLMKQLDSPTLCQAAAVAGTATEAMMDSTLTDAQLQEVCSLAATQICSLLTADGGASGSADGGASSCGSTAGCTATVAQLSACVNDTGASLSTFEKMFPTCSMVTRAGLASVNQDASPAEPGSCKTLDTSCPSFSPMVNLGALGNY